ncbi:MAG: hypothetical protein ABI634_20375 [Acidobacteriota bacterium]
MRLSPFAKAVLSLALPVVLSGCNKTDTSTTPSGTSTAVTITVYAGPLDPGGSTKYLVVLDADATLQVNLAGEQLADPMRTISEPLKIDISTWDGTDCTALDSTVTEPRLTAQLQRFLRAGTYCVRVSDPGTLTQTIGAIVKIAYPAPKLLTGTGSPVTFASVLPPGGTVSKSFVLSTEGTIDATLNSVGGVPGTVVGFALGVVGSDTSTCTITTLIRTTAGSTPQLSARADAGAYCATVIDQGAFTTPSNFTMTIAHP